MTVLPTIHKHPERYDFINNQLLDTPDKTRLSMSFLPFMNNEFTTIHTDDGRRTHAKEACGVHDIDTPMDE